MKINRLLTAIVVTMLSSGAVYAQKVELDNKSGKVFIDASGIANTTKSKAGDASTQDANAKVFKRFEVQTNTISGAVKWPDAVNLCATMSPKNTWRLPTQREMQLIWVLASELLIYGSPYFIPFTKESYWSATRLSNGSLTAYILDFKNGATTNVATTDQSKTSCRVRCIREAQ